jgi:hypothetical protein
MVSQDCLRSSDCAEIVDQAHPYEWVKTTCTDFGDQFSTAKLELTFRGAFIGRRRNGSASARACCHCWSLRINMKGPPAGAAVGDPDSGWRFPLRPALRLQLLFEQVLAEWFTTVWTDRAAGPAIIGLDWHVPIVPERCRFRLGACR